MKNTNYSNIVVSLHFEVSMTIFCTPIFEWKNKPLIGILGGIIWQSKPLCWMQSKPKVNNRPETTGCRTPRSPLASPLLWPFVCSDSLSVAKMWPHNDAGDGQEAVGQGHVTLDGRTAIPHTNCLTNIPLAYKQVCLSSPFAHCKFVKQIKNA